MRCHNNYFLDLPKYPPYHPNCRCFYPEFIVPDDDGGEERYEKKYFMIIYKKTKKLIQ